MTRHRLACSPRSTTTSAWPPRRCSARSACSPARAPARPARSPTASPTASRPGCTPGAGDGAHVHVARRRRAAQRGCARSAPAASPARTFHAAALVAAELLLAAGGRRHRCRASSRARAGCSAEAAERAALRVDTADAARRRRRDRVAQGVAAHAEPSTRAVAATRSLPPTLRAEQVVDAAPGLREAQGRAPPARLRGRAARHAPGMIETEPRVAQQVREQYRFFVVDEYQDVSPLQQAAARAVARRPATTCAWSATPARPSTRSPGASPDYLLGFGSRYRGGHGRAPRAATTAPRRAIVDTANRLMRGRAGALTLRAASDDGARQPPRCPTITAHPSDTRRGARASAGAIADQIAAGTEPQDIAILYRINVQAARVWRTRLERRRRELTSCAAARGSSTCRRCKQALMMLQGRRASRPRASRCSRR